MLCRSKFQRNRGNCAWYLGSKVPSSISAWLDLDMIQICTTWKNLYIRTYIVLKYGTGCRCGNVLVVAISNVMYLRVRVWAPPKLSCYHLLYNDLDHTLLNLDKSYWPYHTRPIAKPLNLGTISTTYQQCCPPRAMSYNWPSQASHSTCWFSMQVLKSMKEWQLSHLLWEHELI